MEASWRRSAAGRCSRTCCGAVATGASRAADLVTGATMPPGDTAATAWAREMLSRWLGFAIVIVRVRGGCGLKGRGGGAPELRGQATLSVAGDSFHDASTGNSHVSPRHERHLAFLGVRLNQSGRVGYRWMQNSNRNNFAFDTLFSV